MEQTNDYISRLYSGHYTRFFSFLLRWGKHYLEGRTETPVLTILLASDFCTPRTHRTLPRLGRGFYTCLKVANTFLPEPCQIPYNYLVETYGEIIIPTTKELTQLRERIRKTYLNIPTLRRRFTAFYLSVILRFPVYESTSTIVRFHVDRMNEPSTSYSIYLGEETDKFMRPKLNPEDLTKRNERCIIFLGHIVDPYLESPQEIPTPLRTPVITCPDILPIKEPYFESQPKQEDFNFESVLESSCYECPQCLEMNFLQCDKCSRKQKEQLNIL
jgi:hypothetical protein